MEDIACAPRVGKILKDPFSLPNVFRLLKNTFGRPPLGIRIMRVLVWKVTS